MENNAIINAGFNEFLQILDARAQVSVFEIDDAGNQTIRFNCAPVYELLTIEKKVFRHYEVVGLYAGLTINIMIRKDKYSDSII